VADQGPGIPPRHRERIFEKFYRIQDEELPRTSGTGLGLAICRAIVTAHGGTIHADGRAGQGARFVVRLPAAPSGIW
jgi:two-component system sensor histidine kinase KdpD